MIGWEQFTEVMSMPAVQRAALALLIGSIGLPLVGVVIVGLNIVPMRFAMMHVALLGIAIGIVAGLDPLVCALVACAIAGSALTPLAGSPGGLSGAAGLLMSMAMAAALLLIAVSGINAASTFGLLWGSILSVDVTDIALVAALAVAVPTLLFCRRGSIAVLFANRELAVAAGLRVQVLTGTLLVLVATAIAVGMQLTGALLVDALTLLPALAARRLGRTLQSICVWAMGVSLLSNSIGFVTAVVFDLPPGPVLVLIAGLFALAVNLIPRSRSRRTPHSHQKGTTASWKPELEVASFSRPPLSPRSEHSLGAPQRTTRLRR